jgi:hypothetical protein
MDMYTDTRMGTGTTLLVTRPHRTRPRPMPPLPVLPHILNRPVPTGTFPLLRALSVRRWLQGGQRSICHPHFHESI